MNPSRDLAQKLVAKGAAGTGDLVHRQPGAPQLHRVANASLRQVGEVDRQHVHRDPPGQGRAASPDQYRSPGWRGTRIAVGVAEIGRAHV